MKNTTPRRALLLYPHQLFQELPKALKLEANEPIFLLEDPLFFYDAQYPARFHIQRLLFHRVSMQRWAATLTDQGYTVHHLKYQGPEYSAFYDHLQEALTTAKVTQLCVPELSDDILTRRLSRRITAWAKAQDGPLDCAIEWCDNPGFLNTPEQLNTFFDSQKQYAQSAFYIDQRKQRGILLDDLGKPLGGKWSFDAHNRKKLPKGHQPPPLPAPTDLDPEVLQSAFADLKASFPNALGLEAFDAEAFLYPTTHAGAKHGLQCFLSERLRAFGDYEDAISAQESYLYHSLLSPLINSGLLTPQQVLDATFDYVDSLDSSADASADPSAKPVLLNDLEGFVRQVMGWREYMRGLYLREGVHMRNQNFWQHTHPMPPSLYTGQTGILPVDHVIYKLRQHAYAHHIERLMILGNFMCLCEIAPTAVYTWFMEFFIDAYDWVMVPNVYSMSQFADGGLTTTKPYISGSNYLRKMGDYPKGEWCDIWDGLYWRFIHKHQDFFQGNHRLRMMVSLLHRMDEAKLKGHLQRANAFLAQLHAQ